MKFQIIRSISTERNVSFYEAVSFEDKKTFLMRIFEGSHANDPAIDAWYNLYGQYQERVSNYKHLPRVKEVQSLSPTQVYVILEHEAGATLRERRRLTPAQGEQLLDAVAHLHAKGLVHGGITPDSVWITDHEGKIILHGSLEWQARADNPQHSQTTDVQQLADLFLHHLELAPEKRAALESTVFSRVEQLQQFLQQPVKSGLAEKERPKQPVQPPGDPIRQERPVKQEPPFRQERPVQQEQPFRQERPVQQERPYRQEQPLPPKRSKQKVLAIVAAVVAGIVVVGGLAYTLGQQNMASRNSAPSSVQAELAKDTQSKTDAATTPSGAGASGSTASTPPINATPDSPSQQNANNGSNGINNTNGTNTPIGTPDNGTTASGNPPANGDSVTLVPFAAGDISVSVPSGWTRASIGGQGDWSGTQFTNPNDANQYITVIRSACAGCGMNQQLFAQGVMKPDPTALVPSDNTGSFVFNNGMSDGYSFVSSNDPYPGNAVVTVTPNSGFGQVTVFLPPTQKKLATQILNSFTMSD